MSNDDKPPTKNINTLHTYETEYNADSVEWCPHEPHQNVFACANYQLKKNHETGINRVGNILLFSVNAKELKLVQSLKTAAILDQKWCHNQVNNQSILGVVNAEKTVEVYALNPLLIKLELIAKSAIESEHEEVLLLSLDWSTGKYSSHEPQIICSDSKGDVHRFYLKNDALEKVQSCRGHEYEAWIAAFYYWDPNIFFSGGDDCCFFKYDRRAGNEPISRNRSHEAGVTSMHSNSNNEHVLATGSYDTNIRVWDVRNMKVSRDSVKMPGPLWRLKWDPHNHELLLAACMLGGVHITSRLEIVDSYYKHANISYGADWCFQRDQNSRTVASCSFYDNLLCVWTVQV